MIGHSKSLAGGDNHATLWTVARPVVAPEEAIGEAAEYVAALVADNTLNQGEGNALISKLEAAQHQIDKGNAKPAVYVLGAFINQVEAMVSSGRLIAEQARPLIDEATTAIELIEAES